MICDCRARNRAGGIYVPPERIFNSFSYSALADACFSSSVMGFRAASFFSCSRTRSASWRSLSRARSSLRRGASPSCFNESPGAERRRFGDGEREGGDRLREAEGCDSPGGGVGTRTADCNTTGSVIFPRLAKKDLFKFRSFALKSPRVECARRQDD